MANTPVCLIGWKIWLLEAVLVISFKSTLIGLVPL